MVLLRNKVYFLCRDQPTNRQITTLFCCRFDYSKSLQFRNRHLICPCLCICNGYSLLYANFSLLFCKPRFRGRTLFGNLYWMFKIHHELQLEIIYEAQIWGRIKLHKSAVPLSSLSLPLPGTSIYLNYRVWVIEAVVLLLSWYHFRMSAAVRLIAKVHM